MPDRVSATSMPELPRLPIGKLDKVSLKRSIGG